MCYLQEPALRRKHHGETISKGITYLTLEESRIALDLIFTLKNFSGYFCTAHPWLSPAGGHVRCPSDHFNIPSYSFVGSRWTPGCILLQLHEAPCGNERMSPALSWHSAMSGRTAGGEGGSLDGLQAPLHRLTFL